MEGRDVASVAAQELESFGPSESWGRAGIGAALESGAYQALVVEGDDGAVRGFSLARLVCDEAELVLVVVAAGLRGRGIGTRLLDATLAGLEGQGIANVFLLVRESNDAARRLYGRRGFLVLGRRRGVYHDPAEDGLELGIDLGGGAGAKSG